MMVALLASVLPFTPVQAHPATGADPASARVVVEELGDVGLRISDAQALATDVVTALRTRMGQDAVVFEGTLSGNLRMKKLLGNRAESQIQDEQVAYLRSAMAAAPYRVRVRFGKKAGVHWIIMSCRDRAAPPTRPLEEARVEGSSFAKAREALSERLPAFCRVADPVAAAPASTSERPPRDKKRREWALPPRRP